MKYILFEVDGVPAPVLFPDYVAHKSVIIPVDAQARKLVSAGFVDLTVTDGTVKANTFGHSESLKVQSRKEDARAIEIVLNQKYARP